MGAASSDAFVEDVELSGHIIDSLLLPKVLDLITALGGSFELKQVTIGHHRTDPSYALIQVQAPSEEQLQQILDQISDHGAVPVTATDCRLVAADCAGAFPEGFYSTTNQRTEVRVGGHWIPVEDQEMDCGICVEPEVPRARCVPMIEVEPGQQFVVGHAGVRVFPQPRQQQGGSLFEFMSSSVSTEKPKGVAVRQIARAMYRCRRRGEPVVLVAGPAVVHTGSGEHLCRLIRQGYVQKLFAGNALAAHDIEQALFGTSLGVRLDRGEVVEHGHEHHLRAINTIRRLGGIAQAVEQGVLRQGICYHCHRHGVKLLLAGSIRDDGPLPEVVTDAVEAQRLMRQELRGVGFCLMLATTLHSIAVGNLLPAWVPVACVDINPSTVIKLMDRGSFQTVGVVTDVEPFLRVLLQELERLERLEAAAGGPSR